MKFKREIRIDQNTQVFDEYIIIFKKQSLITQNKNIKWVWVSQDNSKVNI